VQKSRGVQPSVEVPTQEQAEVCCDSKFPSHVYVEGLDGRPVPQSKSVARFEDRVSTRLDPKEVHGMPIPNTHDVSRGTPLSQESERRPSEAPALGGSQPPSSG
jgi:hypothetical protein